MSPWTQYLGITWPSTLRFYERRIDIARTLEEQSPLRGLRVTEDQVAVFLGNPHHRLSYGASGLEAELLKPDASFERVCDAMSYVLEELEPRRIVRPVAKFQWIVPVDREYDDARTEMAGAALGALSSAHARDAAFLVDGTFDEPAATFQFECGILQAAEAPQRLARAIGRMREGHARPQPPTLWPLESLPKVGFFCDIRCDVGQPVDATPDAVIELWRDIRQAAQGVVNDLGENIGGVNE